MTRLSHHKQFSTEHEILSQAMEFALFHRILMFSWNFVELSTGQW